MMKSKLSIDHVQDLSGLSAPCFDTTARFPLIRITQYSSEMLVLLNNKLSKCNSILFFFLCYSNCCPLDMKRYSNVCLSIHKLFKLQDFILGTIGFSPGVWEVFSTSFVPLGTLFLTAPHQINRCVHTHTELFLRGMM